MRSLSLEQVELVKAAANEGLSQFPAGALEKDIHLTEVLRALRQIESAELELVFCGGTSLVKAYGYLNRMSEDIDIKVVDRSTRTTSATRTQMSQLKAKIADAFLEAGFGTALGDALSANRFMSFNLNYEPQFPSEVSLRPEIKVECTYAPAHLPVETRQISTLLYRDAHLSEEHLDFACIAMEETLAEKVLAFLRRHLRSSASGYSDERLVRHVDDAHILKNMNPNMDSTRRAFGLAVREDAKKFANQDAAFLHNSKTVLWDSLAKMRSDSQLRSSYSEFVVDLVAGDAPEFEAVFGSFVALANELISSLD